MISAVAAASPLPLAERIRRAAERSLRARNLYASQVAADLTASLGVAAKQIRASILDFKSLGDVPAGKVPALRGLEKLNAEIRGVLREVRQDHTLRFRKASRQAFRKGIYAGIGDFTEAQLPLYKDLTPEGVGKLGTRAFTLVDTHALDFLTNYNVALAGDVHRELADGIKRTLLTGIATGKGAEDLVRDLGRVVKDPESFRNAGSKVFTKAQYRMEVIARTEILRAHNQGRLKFYGLAGVQMLEWLTSADERVCPVCGPLDGKIFPIAKLPPQPRHPQCRCLNVVAEPLGVCGTTLAAVAAAEMFQPGAACLLPPQAIEAQAAEKAKETKLLSAAFESGDPGQLAALTVKQLQTLAKSNGVSIARTKADHLKLLGLAEPGVDHSGVGGLELAAKLKFHGIGALRTKEEIVALLAQKQAALVEVQTVAAQLAKLPASGGLHDLTVAELQDLAKAKGIPISLTKQDVVDLLDAAEPGVDHGTLSGLALSEAKKKLGLTPLKNKQQLVMALQKSAGHDLAEAVKQEAMDAVESAAVEATKKAVEEAAAAVVVPPSPASYSEFLAAMTNAEQALAAGGKLPTALLEEHAKTLALKKKLFVDQVASMKQLDLKNLAKKSKVKYWQWTNKEELVTLFTETDPSKLQATKAAIDAKHEVWYGKYGGGKKVQKPAAASPPAPPAPNPVPAPPTLAPAVSPTVPAGTISSPAPAASHFSRKGSEFEPVDAAWKETGQPSRFKFLEVAKIEGAHRKEFYVDEAGEKWLFKPAAEAFRAHGDEVAYRIGRLIDPKAIEVRVISLKGRMGSIQKWRTDLAPSFDFRDVLPEALAASEIEQLQREHVIDWLISNHDGHAKQFLRTKSGQVLGIDKGQLFKFLGSDQLDIDYHPNQKHGESEPFYNTLLRAAKQGKVKVDPSATLRAIREVEKIPEEDYLAILRPYADGRFGSNESGKRAFLDQALSRKRNIRHDFEQFYAGILKRKDFRFEDVATAAAKGRLGPAEEALLRDVEDLGWQGKVLPFDEADVEDQNALVWVESLDGKARTVVKMKVRPEADKRLQKLLKKAAPGTAETKIGEPLPEDEYFGDLVAAVKTAKKHAVDKQFNQGTLAAARAHRSALEELQKSSDPNLREMAESYLGWLDQVEKKIAEDASITGKFEQFTKKYGLPKPKSDAPFTVRKTKVLHSKRTIEKGELRADKDFIDNAALFHTGYMDDGEQYEVEFPDGTRAVYRPWTGKNLYAQRGELELYLPGKPSHDEIDRAIERLETLGLSSKIADAADAELLYLQKQAYLTKTHKDSAYQELISALDARKAPVDERVRELRHFWERRLGVPDVTKLPGYGPLGEYQLGFRKAGAAAGYRQQYRFDLSDADLEKEMAGYALFHHPTGGADLEGLLETVLEHNGAMVSTIEKMRIGVKVAGMSPQEDMKSGGASYFFTRVRKLGPNGQPRESGLYFKKRLLRRMDAVSYGSDKFGRVTENHPTDFRGSMPSDWKRFANTGSNETIFKYSVTLLDNIDVIGVHNEAARKKTLELFHKRGIMKVPDGRAIEEIVRVVG